MGQRCLFLFAATAIMMVNEGSAATMTVGPVNYSVTTYTTGNSKLLDIPKFNSNLGTLTGVSFSVGYAISGVSMTYENLQDSETSFKIGLKQLMSFDAPNVLLKSTYEDLFPFQSVAFGAFDGTADFSGPDTVVVSQTNTVSGTLTSTLSSGLGSYIGSGTFVSHVVSSGLEDLSGLFTLPAWKDNLTGTTSGSVTVTYTYTPVPEPGTLALTGMASLAGLIICGCRQRPGCEQGLIYFSVVR